MSFVDKILIASRRWLTSVLLVCSLAVAAEDITFMNNRRQWEQLPTGALMQMGHQFEHKNLPDSMFLCFSIVANRYDTHSPQGKELEQCVGAIFDIGVMYMGVYYDTFKAHTYMLRARDLAQKHQLKSLSPYIDYNLGNLYLFNDIFHNSPQHEKCLELYREAFNGAYRAKDWNLLHTILLSISDVLIAEENRTEVAKLANQYEQLVIPDSVEFHAYGVQFCKGLTCFASNDLQQSVDAFKQLPDVPHLNQISQKQRAQWDAIIHNITLHLLEELGRYDEALDEINIISREAKENGVATGYVVALGYYHDLYKKLNNHQLADYYELLWLRQRDSVATLSQLKNFEKADFLHEIDKMNEEHQTLALKQRHDRQLLWIVSVAALVAIILLVLLYINRQRIRQSYRQLYEKSQALLAAEDAGRQETMVSQPAEVAVETPKYSHNQMDEDVMDELWLQIKRVMETSDEIYQELFSLDQLTELLNAKRSHVSQTINTKTGKNFYALLHAYRIREACKRMSDKQNYGNYSIEGIAHSLGYSSRSHFVRVFKEATGIPPSAYQKLAQNPPDTTSPSPDDEETS